MPERFDPLASGVLVVCLGAATRLFDYFQRMPKRYRATFLLGRHSPTEDIEGEMIPLENPPVPATAEIRVAAQALTGRIQQRPPAYSAVKVEGRRAYSMGAKDSPSSWKPALSKSTGSVSKDTSIPN